MLASSVRHTESTVGTTEGKSPTPRTTAQGLERSILSSALTSSKIELEALFRCVLLVLIFSETKQQPRASLETHSKASI